MAFELRFTRSLILRSFTLRKLTCLSPLLLFSFSCSGTSCEVTRVRIHFPRARMCFCPLTKMISPSRPSRTVAHAFREGGFCFRTSCVCWP